jgi:hypothetical protein
MNLIILYVYADYIYSPFVMLSCRGADIFSRLMFVYSNLPAVMKYDRLNSISRLAGRLVFNGGPHEVGLRSSIITKGPMYEPRALIEMSVA